MSFSAQARQYHCMWVAKRASLLGMATNASPSCLPECRRMASGETDIPKAYRVRPLRTATLSKCALASRVCDRGRTSSLPATDITQSQADQRWLLLSPPAQRALFVCGTSPMIRHPGPSGKDASSSTLNFSFHFCLFPSISALCRKIIFCINKFIKLTYSRMEITGIT